MPRFLASQKSPVERLVLLILFAQRSRGRGLAHFVTQIEGMRGVQIFRQPAIGAALPQLIEQQKRVRIVQVQFVTYDVNFAAGNERRDNSRP